MPFNGFVSDSPYLRLWLQAQLSIGHSLFPTLATTDPCTERLNESNMRMRGSIYDGLRSIHRHIRLVNREISPSLPSSSFQPPIDKTIPQAHENSTMDSTDPKAADVGKQSVPAEVTPEWYKNEGHEAAQNAGLSTESGTSHSSDLADESALQHLNVSDTWHESWVYNASRHIANIYVGRLL